MKPLYAWEWVKKYVPPKVQGKTSNIVKITDIYLRDPEKVGDITKYHKHPVCLLTGDGGTLPKDVKEFESWGVPHDLYCVNRSMLFFNRQVDHWAAIDIEESCWFSQNVNANIEPERHIVRHTIGEKTFAYDIYWMMDETLTELQRRVFVGSTGFFGVLTAIKMGYEKIVLAGMPLNFDPHWYEPDTEGPQWGGFTYAQWMDFKMLRPEDANKVRSMGSYSAFILGTATKEWVCSNGS